MVCFNPLNFLKAVFHKFYLVHSWILYLICGALKPHAEISGNVGNFKTFESMNLQSHIHVKQSVSVKLYINLRQINIKNV